jgi:predicted O-linked N-acetylglucosamine transferase (SPINDLY family)
VLIRLLRSLALRSSGGRAIEEGSAALRAGDWAAAEAAYRRALAAGDESAGAFHGLGTALCRQQRRLDEGIEALQLAVERDPRSVAYRLTLGAALGKTAPADAVEQFRQARALAPDAPELDALIHKPLMEICAWDDVEAELAALYAHAREEPAERWTLRLDPFVALGLSISPEMRVEAVRWHSRRAVKGVRAMSRPRGMPAGKLRIGYVASEEFCNHAVAHLAVGLFEQHDRKSCEVFAYSLGADDGSEFRTRVVGAFDHFIDVGALSDEQAAARIAADGVDILVDLKAYTAGARTRIFAYRPAPVQVNYLGYPGSMQADFMDYIIADATVVPQSDFGAFSEAVVWMPSSYQANDDRQRVADSAGSRAAQGLPENGFVYCCFNRTYKIERPIFGAWMRILGAVPGSVLWLLAGNSAMEANLRAAARRAGVDPARLVFAPRQKKAEHLARHRLADLFLDTHTYNAHTTASDALWAGLPLLTWPGESFAGRVAASLLRAVGLRELIAPTLADYERIAIELSRDGERLAGLWARLAENRLTMPLFRTGLYARQLEAAFQTMHERRLRGAPPEPFAA